MLSIKKYLSKYGLLNIHSNKFYEKKRSVYRFLKLFLKNRPRLGLHSFKSKAFLY